MASRAYERGLREVPAKSLGRYSFKNLISDFRGETGENYQRCRWKK